ncbi:MAG: dockerin type I domain-containing protein, partial [Candidatus Microsaccharimonas sp.]
CNHSVVAKVLNMAKANRTTRLSGVQKFGIFLMLAIAVIPTFQARNASAAACATPSTDYGQVTGLTTTIDTTGTYRIWTRMAAANTTDSNYLLEIDGSTCFTVGGSNVPVYANGASTYFTNSTANWINRTTSNAVVSMNLTAGTHTIKLIGNAPGVVVDRLIFTASTTCTPTGAGGNCADTTPPTQSSIAASSITNQSATISWTTNDASSTWVEYGTTTSYGSSTTLNSLLVTSHTASLTSLTAGTVYHYRVTSTDEAGNTTVSTDRTFTTAATPTYVPADINQDGVVGILDISLIVSKWNTSGAGLGRSDINSDGTVNALDLSIVIAGYGQ